MPKSDIAGNDGARHAGTVFPSLLRSSDVMLAIALVAVVPVPGMLSGTAWIVTLLLVVLGAGLRRAAVARTESGQPEPNDALRLMVASIVWMFALIAVVVAVGSLAGAGTAIRVLVLASICHICGTMAATGTRIDKAQLIHPFKSFTRPEEEPQS